MSTLDTAIPAGGQSLAVGERSEPGFIPYTTSDTPLVLSHSLGRLRRLKHHVRTACRLLTETQQRAGQRWRPVFVTLTYANVSDWRPRHVSEFLKSFREWSRRRGYRPRYVWVAETQKRGAVHYHLVLWVPRNIRIRTPDKSGLWPWGMSNVQAVKANATGYLMKYVSKGLGDSPPLPKGCRVCGSGGFDDAARLEFHYWRLPRYVRQGIEIGERCRRQPGGGWYSSCMVRPVFRSDWALLAIGKDENGAITALTRHHMHHEYRDGLSDDRRSTLKAARSALSAVWQDVEYSFRISELEMDRPQRIFYWLSSGAPIDDEPQRLAGYLS